MSEDIKPDSGEDTLPGGFESVDAMYAALETAKADLTDNKTRKSDMTNLQAEYEKLRKAEEERLNSERTDLEKAQARIAALESDAVNYAAQVTKANMDVLLERVLSGRLAGINESIRPIASDLYRAAAVGFADEAELNALLDPVDVKLTGLQSSLKDGATVIMTTNTSQGSDNTPKGRQAAIDFLNKPFKEQMKAIRGKKG